MHTKWSAAIAAILAIASPALAADLVVGVPNWPSVTLTANVIKDVVEANMGLTLELQTGTNPVIFAALDQGSLQVHPEVWLPNRQGLVDPTKTALLDSDGNGKGEVFIGATG